MKIKNKKRRLGYFIFDIFWYSVFGIRYSRAAGGFTIVETLVAIAILSLAITGPLALAERSLVAARGAGYEITAFYLAQEAFEFVKNVRDGTFTDGGGSDWLRDLDNSCFKQDEWCGIDVTAKNENDQIVKCDAKSNYCTLSQHLGTPISFQHMKGIYGYPENHGKDSGDWVATSFRRKVFIDEIVKDAEANVRVVVSWSPGGGGERSITVSGNMFNWYAP